MAERGYRNLNTSVLRQISKALEQDPAADIEPVLNKVWTSYSKLRQSICERQAKRRTDQGQEENIVHKKHRASYPAVLSAFASSIQYQPTLVDPRVSERWTLSCSLPHSIIFPLSPVIRNILGIVAGDNSNISSAVLRSVLSGSPIWEGLSRSVIQIGEDAVVKIAQHLDHDEHDVLEFLEEHLPSIPAPRPLGLITIGSTSFMFMRKTAGKTLETRWPSLSSEAKAYIRRVLDEQLIILRKLGFPHDSPFGSPIGPRLCKDVRRDSRISASPIYCESQFNHFLLDSPTSRAALSHKKWLRSMLRTDHRVVFTHADFHPRNIMVVDAPSGNVELSGILDWESSGFYPEYWEQLKAMNTRSIKDSNDWWDHLPPSILGYDHEIVVDQLIESTVIY